MTLGQRRLSAGQLPTYPFSTLPYVAEGVSLSRQECNNLLYPKADAQRRIMVYACRINLGRTCCKGKHTGLTFR